MTAPSTETAPPALSDKDIPASEIQRLWFAALRRDWSSLAVLPAHPEGSADGVAQALARVARLHKDEGVKVISARGADLAATSRLIIDMTSHVSTGGLCIVVLDSVLTNAAGIPLALAADAALLCVELGEADSDSARRTVELVGASRFVGAVTVPAF
jgi:hypothetical protein